MRTSSLRVLLDTFRHYRRHLAALVVLGLVGALFEGVGINAVIPLLSFLLASGPPADPISRSIEWLFAVVGIAFTFRSVLVFMFSLFILRAVTLVAFSALRGWITADFAATEGLVLAQRSLLLSWDWFRRQKAGYLQNTQVRDLQRTASLLEAVSQTIQSFTGFVMYLAVALAISLPVTLATFFGGGALLLVLRPLVRRSRTLADRAAQEEKILSHQVAENTIGMKAIKAAGIEQERFALLEAPIRALKQVQVRAALVRALGSSFFQPFSLFFVMGVFALTYTTSAFNLAVFAATLYLIQKIFTYLESGQGAFHTIGELIPYAENIGQFKRDAAAHEEPLKYAQGAYELAGPVEFRDVSFAYADAERGQHALRDVSFTLRPGEAVGITGPSGAGKSSVADLLLRLFAPSSGEICAGGVSLTDIPLASWRGAIGYMTQDIFLVNGSIEENIRFFRADISAADIARAVEEAGLGGFIARLPAGLATEVGDRGVALSGGERQRVALARVLAARPALLILDEATSALDAASERVVQDALEALRGKTTLLVIAHRLPTLAQLDRVIVLKEGQVVEEGVPAQLARDSGSYLAMLAG